MNTQQRISNIIESALVPQPKRTATAKAIAELVEERDELWKQYAKLRAKAVDTMYTHRKISTLVRTYNIPEDEQSQLVAAIRVLVEEAVADNNVAWAKQMEVVKEYIDDEKVAALLNG